MPLAAGGADRPPPPPTSALGPGFRFHPTDEELVKYYLWRKVTGQPLRFDCIAEVDLYKFDPWDLPGHSRLKTRDLEWYFYTGLDKKYANGGKTNRATGNGYWKTTGKDHPVVYQARVVGMRKTLVYHAGRAPVGVRTNWVMHEYRLEDEELAEAGVSLDTYVLCRIFEKSGAGPKNGEQYGAPFIEEEWEDEENEIALPKANTDNNDTEGLGYLGADVANATMQQSINSTSQTTTPTLPPLHTSDFIEQTPMKENNEAICHVKLPCEDFIELNDVITPTNVGCTNNLNDGTLDYDVLFNDENILSEFLSDDGGFLQQDDLAYPIEGGDLLNIPEASSPEADWIEEFLKKMSDVDDNQQTLSNLDAYPFSAHQSVITETPVTAQASQEHDIAGSSSSKRKANSSYHGFEEKAPSSAEVTQWPDGTDLWYKDFGNGWGDPLAKRLHGMLECIPFSPAFAAETSFEVSGKAMEEEPALASAGPLRIHASIFHVSDNTMAHHIPKGWLLYEEGINDHKGFLITSTIERMMSNYKAAPSSLFLSRLFLCFMWLVLLAVGAKMFVSMINKCQDTCLFP